MSMAVVEVLVAARALIEDPAHWCRGAFAIAADGEQVDAYDVTATRWCGWGALDRTALRWAHQNTLVRKDRERAEDLLRDAAIALYHSLGIAAVNDRGGHAAVLACYDHAIAAARAAEGQVPS